jgi:hypothetical protein
MRHIDSSPAEGTSGLCIIEIQKWVRILFRCWKERKPYDEAIYQRALDARRPKKQLAAPAVELQWKNVAGFLKIGIKEA